MSAIDWMISKSAGLLLLALAGAALYWKLSFHLGLPLLLFLVSLAVVGKGNRWLWSAIFPLISCVLSAVIYAGYAVIPAGAEFVKLLLAFTLVSVVPGVVLWAAVRLKRARNSVTAAKAQPESRVLPTKVAGGDA
jgi:hypothetical protein